MPFVLTGDGDGQAGMVKLGYDEDRSFECLIYVIIGGINMEDGKERRR